jgi:hypothetical protein
MCWWCVQNFEVPLLSDCAAPKRSYSCRQTSKEPHTPLPLPQLLLLLLPCVASHPEAYATPAQAPHRVSKSVCDLDDSRLEGKQQAGCCAECQQDGIHGDA